LRNVLRLARFFADVEGPASLFPQSEAEHEFIRAPLEILSRRPLSMTPRHSHSTDKWRSRRDRAGRCYLPIRDAARAHKCAPATLFKSDAFANRLNAHDNLIAIYYGDMVRRPQRPTNLFREGASMIASAAGDSMHSVECGKRRDSKLDQPDCTAKPDAGGCGDFRSAFQG